MARTDYIHAADFSDIPPVEVARRLEATLSDPNYSPPLLPTVALEVAELSRDPRVDLRQIRKLLETEPLLAGQVIKLAQSSFYSGAHALRSLDEALTRLGTKTLADLFLQVAVSARVFRAKGYEEPMNAIRRHSVACAYLARKICEKSKLPEGYAFLCGLLHDAGMAASLIVLADVPRGKTPPAYDRVRESVDSVHANASHVLAKSWGLPEDIQSVLRNHHRFSFSDKPDVTVAVIAVADMLVTQAGLPAGAEQTERQGAEAARALRLSSERLAELAEFAKAVREHLI